MPSGLIDENDCMRAGRNLRGDFGEVEVHRFSVASGHDERRALAVPGTDRPEDIGRCGSLIFGRAGARASSGPASGDFVLLADARLVGEPDLYGVGLDAFVACDLVQAGWECFLKSSRVRSACA
jgi:hypothetical protein